MVFHPPAVIIAKVGLAGKGKCGLPAWNMLLRGFMAGAYIAMGAALATVCSTGVADALGGGMAKLVLGAVFPVGLIIIVLTGAELFTGDAMFAPMAAMIHKTSWASVLNLWLWVYIGNLIGSIVFAYFVAYGPYLSWSATGAATVTSFGMTAVSIAAGKTSYVGLMATWSCFLKAICCNWLVNLAILLGICADDAIGKIVGIWFPIMAFVASGFEHCVANMFFIPAGLFTAPFLSADQLAVLGTKVANLTWVTMWTQNIIVVTIGNIVGGMIFVGVLYYYSFRQEIIENK
ncbi:formate/nitrite transporter family protein [Methanomicrobium antiquum]|uniref:Formate/nitrite transporter family protein n=1 Tax=Methanomicrobium antiquum TaxID=487686 RepID=A0AAF0FTS1_9EURY|nr:formate/nitrite transporter family protein [Methanomicrobium antiquum]WFN37791.1 formate/nitrite transporter family protein [Methanomicrobium antiquum]